LKDFYYLTHLKKTEEEKREEKKKKEERWYSRKKYIGVLLTETKIEKGDVTCHSLKLLDRFLDSSMTKLSILVLPFALFKVGENGVGLEVEDGREEVKRSSSSSDKSFEGNSDPSGG